MLKTKHFPPLPSNQVQEVFVEMPQRNSKKQDQNATVLRRTPRFHGNNSMTQSEPTTTPRRSLRLLAKTRVEPAPKTPSDEPKTPKERVKPGNSGARNVLKESNLGKEGFVIGNEGFRGSVELKGVGEGSSCLRRSSRLSDKENIKSRSRLNFDEGKREAKDLGNKNSGGKKIKMGVNVIGLAAGLVGGAKKKGNSNKENVVRIAKKVTRNRSDRVAEDLNAELLGKGDFLSVEKISKSGLAPSEQEKARDSSKAPVKSKAEREARAAEKKSKCIGVKRKRNQVEDGVENHGTVSGWTKEQESALHNAYYAANVTPRFWKKVAKMVPGKSAQDCFNRIHDDYQTPRQARPRSRARLQNSSPISYSASKLLDSIRPKSKRPGYTKRKSHLVQKTTRQLLQKQCQVNRDQNADLFSVLEPQVSPFSSAVLQGVNCSTPKPGGSELLRRCQEPSSSARKMQCSRFNSMNEASHESPPVLKPIKDRALHEKYIDQLHAREAKRRAVAARAAKSSLKVLDRKEGRVQKNAVEAAKNALLLDARDAIKQFQHVQATDLSCLPDDDDDVLNSDEDRNEGENSL